MAKHSRTEIGLLILMGIGIGTLIGVSTGIVIGHRLSRRPAPDDAESVDELKEKARLVLDELSENVSELLGKSRVRLQETQEPVGETIENGIRTAPSQMNLS